MGDIPKVRFKGFTNAWEQRRFGDLADYKKGPFGSALKKDIFVPKDETTVKIYEQQNAINKDWTLERYFITKEYAEKLSSFEVQGGYIIVSCAGTIGETYEIPMDAESGIINQALMRIKVNGKVINKKMYIILLQKMFPQAGKKIPEIRFAGFTDDWEQRKLDDWGTFYYGRSCPKWSVTEDATIPCIRYGELYTKFGAKIDKVYSYTNVSPENLRFSKGTEVLIPRVGEDPMDYNHCTWLSMPNVAIGEMISVFNSENNPLFTATMFNATLQKEFAMRVEGGSVTNLYFEKLKNIEVSFPTLEEQEKIADYFDTLSNLITLHQRKCDELKEVKKYMLQNMFPQKG